ncbi:MAG: hypothetical protein WCL23_02065 [Candidatus Moraniibacteriota bacterium]
MIIVISAIFTVSARGKDQIDALPHPAIFGKLVRLDAQAAAVQAEIDVPTDVSPTTADSMAVRQLRKEVRARFPKYRLAGEIVRNDEKNQYRNFTLFIPLLNESGEFVPSHYSILLNKRSKKK